MKKYRLDKLLLIAILSLIGSHQLWAGPIGLRKAKAIASHLIEVEEDNFRASSSDNPSYYIFNGKGKKGFVIVSGENHLPSVIAYSRQSYLDYNDLPIQLKSLLKSYDERVKDFRKNGGKDEARARKVFIRNPQVVVEPLLTSKWSQRKPFNSLMPKVNGSRRPAPAGCVATAMGQIMYYHKWPERGEGKHSYTNPITNVRLSARFWSSRYEWDKMENIYRIHYIKQADGSIKENIYYDEKKAKSVAKLMYDIGVSVDMQYGLFSDGGSGTYTRLAAKAFNEYFKYKAEYIVRDACYGDEFMDIIRRELKEKRPIIFSGSSTSSGHAWVVDGYDENDYLHCNWGWEGVAEGYFDINNMRPSTLGIGGGDGVYNDQQDIIIVRPNKTGAKVKTAPLRLTYFLNGYLDYKSKPKIAQSEKISLLMTNWGTLSVDEEYVGQIGIAFYDEQGKVVKVEKVSGYITIGTMPRTTLEVSAEDLDEGVYMLSAVSRVEEGEWIGFQGGNKIKLCVKDGTIKYLANDHDCKFKLVAPTRDYLTAFEGGVAQVAVRVKNASSRITDGCLLVKMEHQSTGKSYEILLDDNRFYSLETKSMILSLDFSQHQDIKAGVYKLSFYYRYLKDKTKKLTEDYLITNPYKDCLIKILDPTKVPDLICSSIDFAQDWMPLYTFHITPKLISEGQISLFTTIKNVSDRSFTGMFIYCLQNVDNGYTIDLFTSAEERLDVGKTMPSNKLSLEQISFNEIPDGLYELHIIAKNEELEFDVWNKDFKRYYLDVLGFKKAEEVVPKEKDDKKEKKEDPADDKKEDDKKEGEKPQPEKKDEKEDPTKTAIVSIDGQNALVYPTNVSQLLHIKGSWEIATLYNMSGVRLKTYPLGGATEQSLDLSYLAKGYYLLKLSKAQKTMSIKLYKK